MLSNVKVAANFAEKKYQACTARAIMNDYNAVSDSLISMKMELVGFHQETKSMESKIQIWSRNVNLMESRQSQLRLKLTELGVNITSFSNQGTFVEGFQELISTPGLVATPATYSGAPNFNFPTVSAGTAAATSSTPAQMPTQQSVVSVEGQNVLVSGAGPIQVTGRSMRWGRVLKGHHNYFCSQCQ